MTHTGFTSKVYRILLNSFDKTRYTASLVLWCCASRLPGSPLGWQFLGPTGPVNQRGITCPIGLAEHFMIEKSRNPLGWQGISCPRNRSSATRSKATKTALLVFACALLLGFQSSDALAAGFDLSKAEAAGNDLITQIRGNLATIVLTIAFIVTGFLAAFNKIPWFWFFAVVLGGFFIFGSTDLANGIKGLFS